MPQLGKDDGQYDGWEKADLEAELSRLQNLYASDPRQMPDDDLNRVLIVTRKLRADKGGPKRTKQPGPRTEELFD